MHAGRKYGRGFLGVLGVSEVSGLEFRTLFRNPLKGTLQ